jgi:para-aminobenzoate synthetase
MKTVVIDNYDSYTQLIAYYLWQVNGEKPLVIRNDAVSLRELKHLDYDNIVLSPGPGNPTQKEETGLCSDILEDSEIRTTVPILGICLGHQLIGHHFGASITPAPRPMHGKKSTVILDDSPLFEGLDKKINVMRYHSLMIAEASLRPPLKIIAKTIEDDPVPMALQHESLPIYGLQFHPESFGTSFGMTLFRNFHTISLRWRKESQKVTPPSVHFMTKKIPWQDPLSVFASVYEKKTYNVWLDSNKKNRNGRYSFMGEPSVVVSQTKQKSESVSIQPSLIDAMIADHSNTKNSPLDLIAHIQKKEALHRHESPIPFKGGFVGYISYEYAEDLGYPIAKRPERLPTMVFMWIEVFFIFDHEKKECFIGALGKTKTACRSHISALHKAIEKIGQEEALSGPIKCEPSGKAQLPYELTIKKEAYLQKIEKIKALLNAGETYEVCLSNEFTMATHAAPFQVYKELRLTNPAPYSAYMSLPQWTLLSSSPECFLRVDANKKMTSEPIKGTRAKGRSNKETKIIAEHLKHHDKENAELSMITDLIRNDLSQFCQKKSLNVDTVSHVTEYETLLQLSSVITGDLSEKYTVIDVIKGIFPGGSITGAPKYRTMQFIDDLEQRSRGIYTGIIGYFSIDGTSEFNIAIRTLLHDSHTQQVTFGSGGAITVDSDPESEFEEILTKAQALILAVRRAHCRPDATHFKTAIKSS